MKNERVICDNITRYRILSKPYLFNRDLQILEDGCSSQNACNLKARIRLFAAAQGITTDPKCISPQLYIKYRKIDFARVQELAHADLLILSKIDRTTGASS